MRLTAKQKAMLAEQVRAVRAEIRRSLSAGYQLEVRLTQEAEERGDEDLAAQHDTRATVLAIELMELD